MFCPLPWISTNIRNNGDLRLCCHSNHGPDKGLLRKSDNTVYNAKNDSFSEAINSEKSKDTRLKLLNNKWPEDCIRCKREEAAGIRSRFTYEKEIWADYIDEDKARTLTKNDGTIDPKPVYFDIRFGNKCNLACRICSPTDSSLWYKDHYNLHGNTYWDTGGKVTIEKNSNKYYTDNTSYEWYKSESFWKELKKQIPYIKHVHMVGGEPLIINEQYKFLEECIKQGYAKNIIIEHNSNIVNIPDKAWNLWKHFKTIKIGASIDGFGKANDYMRYPSKWENIEKNLLRFENEKDIDLRIWIACTVSIYNIYYLPEFFEWIISQNFKNIGSDWMPIASLHPLHAPKHLNCKILPLNVKNKIKKHFDEFSDSKFKDKVKPARKLLNQYLEYMFQDDWSSEMPKFLEINNKLDKLRNTYMKDYLPELIEMLEKNNV